MLSSLGDLTQAQSFNDHLYSEDLQIDLSKHHHSSELPSQTAHSPLGNPSWLFQRHLKLNILKEEFKIPTPQIVLPSVPSLSEWFTIHAVAHT